MIVSSSPEREADFESAISSFSKPRKRSRAPAVRFWNGWSTPPPPPPPPPPGAGGGGERAGRVDRDGPPARPASQLRQRAVADAAVRHIDHPHQGDRVVGVMGEPQV